MPDWKPICLLTDIPRLGARRVARPQGAAVALFRTADDRLFALLDRCPHKGGPLSQGIVFGDRVACPLHNWSIGLADGCAAAPDEGCTVPFSSKLEDGRVFLEYRELVERAIEPLPAAACMRQDAVADARTAPETETHG